MTQKPVNLGRNFNDVVEVEANMPLIKGSIDNLIGTSGQKSRPLGSANARRRSCGVTRRGCVSIVVA